MVKFQMNLMIETKTGDPDKRATRSFWGLVGLVPALVALIGLFK